MRITKAQIIANINNPKFKAHPIRALKMVSKPPVIPHERFDAFEKSFIAKEKEIRSILDRKNVVSNGLSSELAKYKGDDYKFAKLIAENIENTKTGIEINLNNETMDKIRALKIECPIFKSWRDGLLR